MMMKQEHRVLWGGGCLAILLVLGTTLLGSAGEPPYDNEDLTTLTPIDPAAFEEDLGAVNDAILAGIREWSQEIGVKGMTEDEIAKNIDTISVALRDLPDDDSWWVNYRQLSGRQIEMCLHLPKDNPYVDDYCRVTDEVASE